MMSILSDEGSRLFIFNRFLQIENKLDDDWFRKYFETEQAERKKKKQDFTPKSAIAVLNQLIGNDGSSYYDIILQRLIQFNYPKNVVLRGVQIQKGVCSGRSRGYLGYFYLLNKMINRY